MHLGKVIVILTTAFIGGCQAYSLGKRMQDLCNKDGGLKVYETVQLPEPEYSKIFQHSPPPTHADERFGPEYKYTLRTEKIAGTDESQGGVVLRRTYQSIARRSDGKLLGEYVGYSRRVGDRSGRAEPRSTGCPRPIQDLGRAVFLRKEWK